MIILSSCTSYYKSDSVCASVPVRECVHGKVVYVCNKRVCVHADTLKNDPRASAMFVR